MFSILIERALRIAAAAHVGQVRKGSGVPYLTHPVQVAIILERCGFDDDRVFAAAILHDVVEDTTVTLAELATQFPAEVIEWVDALSERKLNEAGELRTWEERKREHLDHLAHVPVEARAIALADKLHNLEAMAYDIAHGADIWSRFNAPRERLKWYYLEVIATATQNDLVLAPLAAACRDALDRVFL